MLEQKQLRRVVPRWRPSWITASAPEALSPRLNAAPSIQHELISKLSEFKSDPSVPVASELMFIASRSANADFAKEAADFILARRSTIGETALIRAARRVSSGITFDPKDVGVGGYAKAARKLLAIDYRNPIVLVDLARELTARGHSHNARRYIRAALELAPNSRFVTRSAARFFLHIEDHAQAHNVLKRSPLLHVDPWIQASEIAVATVRGKTSKLTRNAIRSISESATVGAERSELASAVATVEFFEGSSKKAKRLFQKSLARPNDNSLAQAEWAAEKLGLVVDEVALRTPLSFEANSNNAYRNLKIQDAIRHADEWAQDEPFSSRPFGALTFLYSLAEDFEAAKRAAEQALKVNGAQDLTLQLNLAFARTHGGDLEGVERDLSRLLGHQDAKAHAAHFLANFGALAFATGELDSAHDFYGRAIEFAKRKGALREAALASAYFARAAFMHGDEAASQILKSASDIAGLAADPGSIYVVQRLSDANEIKRLTSIAANRVAKRKWSWDATSNTLRLFES